jgi:hypothetical protein
MNIAFQPARLLALLSLLALSHLAVAATPEDLIRPIQEQWAEIKYRQPEKQQADRLPRSRSTGAPDRRQQPEDARAADLGGHRPLQ